MPQVFVATGLLHLLQAARTGRTKGHGSMITSSHSAGDLQFWTGVCTGCGSLVTLSGSARGL